MSRKPSSRDEVLFTLLDRLDADGPTVVSSVRQPAALKEALKVAVELGLDANANDATVQAVRDRVEAFAQRRALDAHYVAHPDARPTLAELAQAAAELDDDPLAGEPTLLRRAAQEIVDLRPDATADDVLVYAAGVRSQANA
ncbi:MAG TPA: hypothetical protein VHT30_09675 [Acidimicrobiales bacterium]|jgi:hypothetical protein|nr:hypothetical protein [Acidimicrobiales bacterium]